jgi:hypothetical protein
MRAVQGFLFTLRKKPPEWESSSIRYTAGRENQENRFAGAKDCGKS